MNPYEQLARERKAQAIAAVLVAHDCTAFQTRCMPTDLRELAARKASQKKPSDATWQRVVKLVQAFERRPKVDDPFAGISGPRRAA